MTWLLFMSGWLVAAVVLGVVMGRAIRVADEDAEAQRRYQRALDELEQRRRERFRRAIGDGQ